MAITGFSKQIIEWQCPECAQMNLSEIGEFIGFCDCGFSDVLELVYLKDKRDDHADY